MDIGFDVLAGMDRARSMALQVADGLSFNGNGLRDATVAAQRGPEGAGHGGQ